ncbi:MAG: hypothetical protein K2Q11_02625, partial [Burkholderiaceae bacterium]|nr:hypothetical protein [Burkholderiaceae bacterium]
VVLGLAVHLRTLLDDRCCTSVLNPPGIELKRTDEAVAVTNAAVHNSAPSKPAKRIELPSSSSSSFFEELQTAVEQEALSNWQLTRIAKKRSALPTPLQCKLLVAQAREIGKPLGWIVQVMALNDWASFDKSWLQNQRPAPKLPMQEPPVIDKPASPATTVARAPVPNPYTPAQVPAKPGGSDSTDGAEEQAKFRAMMAKIPKSMAPAKTVASRTDGKQKWVDFVERARRGDYVSHYALTSACQVLGINYSALKAEIAASKTEAATA